MTVDCTEKQNFLNIDGENVGPFFALNSCEQSISVVHLYFSNNVNRE